MLCRPLLLYAPGRAHLLGGNGEIPPKFSTRPTGGVVSRTARGFTRKMESEGSPQAEGWPDEQKAHEAVCSG